LAYNREALCGKLGLDKNKFTVLLITGSFGIGNIEGIVNALCLDYQVLVVCAGNKRLYEKLKRKNYPQVRVFGFIDNIQELMAVSGLIITKPGGLTVSEALAMELPPIFISAIPGQEDGNIKALATYGVGLKPGDIEELKSLVEEYKSCPERAEIIKQGIREIKKPFACEELYNVIRQGGLWPAR
jgi:processive 1,2-diacylglycerol beta-glucosyltransferase